MQRKLMYTGSALAFVATVALSWTPGLAAQSQEMQDWSEMQQNLYSVDQLLAGIVSNGLNPIGMVDKLILNEDKNQVEYILLDSPYPYFELSGVENGFILFDQAEIRQTFGLNTYVYLREDAAPSAPEEIALSREEAEERLAGNLLDSHMRFAGGQEREITDIMVHRETGELAYYVVAMDETSLFNTDAQLIPAERVRISEEGVPTLSVDIAAAQDLEQEFDEGLL